MEYEVVTLEEKKEVVGFCQRTGNDKRRYG